MAENSSRASSSTEEAFWNKSFQTSTGYVDEFSAAHFNSAARLLAVRLEALEEGRKERKRKALRADANVFQCGPVTMAPSFLG